VGLYDNIRALSNGELRTIGGVPWMPWLNPFMPFSVGGPVHPSQQIMGTDRALGLPALYAAVKILADGAASLPMRVYNKSGSSVSLYQGPTLFDNPSAVDTKFDWIFAAMSSVLLHGNAWGLITGKDKYGFPKGIEWLPPERVYVQESDQQSFNPLKAKVLFDGREMKWFGPDKELFHVRGFKQAGRLEGLSAIRYFAQVILAGHQTQEYGLSWFNSGGFPPGIFKNAELEVDPDQAAKVRAMLTSVLRKHEPLVIGRDWDYTPVTVPPSEAQFIDAMQLNATQIAAIFNLPPDRVGGKRGDSLTYNTVEQSTLQVIEALTPWLVRFEEAFSALLPGRRYIRFWTDALLRTDLQTRINNYNTQRRMGLLTINEIREREDLPALPNQLGDDTLPLDLMVAMATRAGAVPKSMDPEINYLMDHAAKLLVKLQKTGAAQIPQADPNTGEPVPSADSPQQMLAQMISQFSRKHPELAYDGRVLALRDLSDRLNGNYDPGHQAGAIISNGWREWLDR
jgi:HK97 family phage portal protein